MVWQFATRGRVGDAGATGDTGAKGDTGDQGIQGVKGDKGDTGESAVFDSRIKLYLSADQAIVTATWTKILFNAWEYDGLSEFDSDNNQILIAAAGYYNIGYYIPMQAIGDGKACEIRPAIGGAVGEGGYNHQGNAVHSVDKIIGSWSGYYAAETTFYLDIYHDHGSNRSVHYTSHGGARFWLNRFA